MGAGRIKCGFMRSSRYRHPHLAGWNRPVEQRACDFPGCDQAGLYRAPRSRARLNEYFWFCLDHVRAYNKRWDFLEGLSPDEIERHIRHATVWERPSWPFAEARRQEQKLRDSIHRAFFSDAWDEEDPSGGDRLAQAAFGEREALLVLGLEHPAGFATIKEHYRRLVKKHHPDANGGSREAEEKFKIINHAFTTLKALYEEKGSGIGARGTG